MAKITRIHFFKFDEDPVDFDENNFYVSASVLPGVEKGDLIVRFKKNISSEQDLRSKDPRNIPIDVGNGGKGYIDVLKSGFGFEIFDMKKKVRK